MLRVFVGINLPENAKEALGLYCQNLDTEWVKKENLHITMSFVGEVDQVSYRTLLSELERIDLNKFEIKIKGVGYFKSKKGPRTIWAGIDRSSDLIKLKDEIDGVLEELGINFDRRTFHPHVTLARPKGLSYDLFNKYMEEISKDSELLIPIDSFEIFSSKLTDDGVEYAIENQYHLT
jgi:2'-5' RNA ligase